MTVETADAYYPEGDQALSKFIFHNLKYSEEAKAHKVSGEVMVSYWVETDSTLSNIRVITDLGYGCSENLSALMKNIKYVPAKVNGVPMKSKVLATFPIRAH
jgi:protein TonB